MNNDKYAPPNPHENHNPTLTAPKKHAVSNFFRDVKNKVESTLHKKKKTAEPVVVSAPGARM